MHIHQLVGNTILFSSSRLTEEEHYELIAGRLSVHLSVCLALSLKLIVVKSQKLSQFEMKTLTGSSESLRSEGQSSRGHVTVTV